MQLKPNQKLHTMNKMKLPVQTTMYIFSAFLMLFASCAKPVDPQNCSSSVSSLSGTYKIVAIKYKATASAQEMDYLPFLNDCEKDDQVKLNSDKTYTTIDAGIVCNPSTNDQGTWNLVGNKIESDGQIQGDILSFDCTTLVVQSKDALMPGDKLTFTFRKL